MTYKLIAVDIDGTLLNSKGELTQKTKEKIVEAVNEGVVFTISTGRPIQGVMPLVEKIGLDIPLITYNGSMVLKAKTMEIIYSRSLMAEDSKKIFQIGSDWDMTMMIWSDNKLYSNKENEKSGHYSQITNTPLIVVKSMEEVEAGVTKFLWYEDENKIKEFMPDLIGRLNSKTVSVHTSRPYFLEFVDSMASKAIAIEKLGEVYDIKREEVIAIGDSYNDISMLEYAGMGIAMDNAPDDIKKIADYVTKSCDDDGVAHAIDRFIFGGKI